MDTVSVTSLNAAYGRVLADFTSWGAGRFCGTYKPLIDKAVTSYRP
jgi:hypothetical protein